MDSTFVIWSYEHRAWWRSRRCGYATALCDAGYYSGKDAGEIVTDSVLIGEIAIRADIAAEHGPPPYHPYDGKKQGDYR